MRILSITRMLSSKLRASSIVAAVLLLLGIPIRHWVEIGNHHYYNYVLLRLVVCFIAAYCAYMIWNQNRMLVFWAMIGVAFILNPLVVFAFLRPVLIPLDIFIAIFFLAVTMRPQITETSAKNNGQLKRLLFAGCAALAIDISIADSFRFRFGDDLTIGDRINEFLAAPAWKVIEPIAPEGNIAFVWYGILIVSALFYGLIIWLILSLSARLRADSV
ncbi:MAG: hypothetical protein JXA73_03475 [Acidobacteria bacterium]|nr:hypothetical protein [Acidobacteriota bacterium]